MRKTLYNLSKCLFLLSALFSLNIQAQMQSDVSSNKASIFSYENPYLYVENMDAIKVTQKEPNINTQKKTFLTNETVHINGDEFEAFERVRLTVSQLYKYSDNILFKQWDTYADGKGRILTVWDLNNEVSDANDFVIVANGSQSGKSTKTWISTSQLTGETISQLSQCANGPGLPQNQNCPEQGAKGWVSGNVGASKSQYIEGDSISYRVILDNLDVGDVYEYTFGWDVTKGGLNAIDYLTTYNRSITGANPCKGTTDAQVSFHCNQGSPTTVVAVPVDPIVSSGLNRIDEGGGGDDISQVPGVLTMWGGDMVETSANCTAAVGTACGLSAYNYTDPVNFPAGDESASIKITFKATDTKMVLAWGGHIAKRSDWGRPNGSVNITGSPYHMFNMSGNNLTEGTTNIFSGNREVQLSTASIIPVGRIIIYKHVSPSVGTIFNFAGDFTTSNYAAGTSMSLADTDSDFLHTPLGLNPSVPASSSDDDSWVANDITDFTNTLTVTETPPGGFRSDGIACSVTEDFSGNNDTTFPSGNTAGTGSTTMGIILGAGDEVTCTYFSSFVTAADVSINGRVLDSNGRAVSRALVTITDSAGDTRIFRANQFGYFRFSDIEAGSTILLNVEHKNHQFSPQLFTVNDSIDSLEIFAD